MIKVIYTSFMEHVMISDRESLKVVKTYDWPKCPYFSKSKYSKGLGLQIRQEHSLVWVHYTMVHYRDDKSSCRCLLNEIDSVNIVLFVLCSGFPKCVDIHREVIH